MVRFCMVAVLTSDISLSFLLRCRPLRPLAWSRITRSRRARKKPVLIVLGNEENGISEAVRKNCDELVIIPWGGMKAGAAESLVYSLNVAQAASVIFYELTK